MAEYDIVIGGRSRNLTVLCIVLGCAEPLLVEGIGEGKL